MSIIRTPLGLFIGVIGVMCQHGLIARTVTAPSQKQVAPAATLRAVLIDDFKDGNITRSPQWRTFGGINAQVEANNQSNEPGFLGRYSLHLSGKANGVLVGGLSVYLSMDGSIYSGIQLTLYSPSQQAGRLTVELYDDDNRNCIIEPNPYYHGHTLADDRWVTDIAVNWRGWRTVTIPFTQFFDQNPGIGDDKWNPVQMNGSCGLVQMQLLLHATKKGGAADIRIDSIRLLQGEIKPGHEMVGPQTEILDVPYSEMLDSTKDEP